jgi:sulfite exporter TauE/SafE
VIALLGGVFVASLLGGTHCVAMCGGFVCFYAGTGGDDGARGRRRLAHVAYHAGRLVAYATLGAIAGGLGAGVESLGAWAGIERAASLAAGALMIAWGAGALLRASGRVAAPQGSALKGALGGALRGRVFAATRLALAAIHAWPPASRALAVGLLTALLPCGWLWAFLTTAAGTAHPAWGAVTMAVFWAGTVPLLAGLGVAAQAASAPLRRRLPVFTSILLLAVGLLTVAGRWAPHRSAHAHGSAGATTTASAEAPHACH